MVYVICSNYSRYFDMRSGIEFSPILDRRNNHYVSVASVKEDQVHHFENRPGFEVLTDAEYAAVTQAPPSAPKEAPQSGDPLTDIAQDNPQAGILNAMAKEPMPKLKEEASRYGIVVKPGMSKVHVAGLIIAAMNKGADADVPPVLPSGPPVPPSSED